MYLTHIELAINKGRNISTAPRKSGRKRTYDWGNISSKGRTAKEVALVAGSSYQAAADAIANGWTENGL